MELQLLNSGVRIRCFNQRCMNRIDALSVFIHLFTNDFKKIEKRAMLVMNPHDMGQGKTHLPTAK